MKTRIIVALIISIVTITSAFTQTRVDVRQKSQRIRIHEGWKCGEITRREAMMLKKQQRQIHRSEFRANADGNVSARENVKLDRMQDKAGRNIRRAKNNAIESKD